MANTLLTIDMITYESLMVLENTLNFTKHVNRDYSDYYAESGAKIGDTLNIRQPPRYISRTGPALQVQNTTETYVPVTLTQEGCDISFSSKDMTLSIDNFSDRFIKPMVATVANKIDQGGTALYKDVYNAVGTPGTTPTSLNTYLAGKVKLDNSPTPMDEYRCAALNSVSEAGLIGNLTTLFNPTKEISDQYRDGSMGKAIGFKWTMDQNMQNHTFGTLDPATNLTVNTAPSTGASSISITGFTNGDTLSKGDVFTIAGVYAVNQQSRQSTGQLQQFVVTTAVSASSGANTVSISPSIIYDPSNNQFQTVDSLPVAGAAVTVLGQSGIMSGQNLMFHRDAFTLANADMWMPNGGIIMGKRVKSDKLNMSIRMVQAYDVNNDRAPLRLDVLYGWATLRPELACRVCA